MTRSFDGGARRMWRLARAALNALRTTCAILAVGLAFSAGVAEFSRTELGKAFLNQKVEVVPSNRAQSLPGDSRFENELGDSNAITFRCTLSDDELPPTGADTAMVVAVAWAVLSFGASLALRRVEDDAGVGR